jgi:RND family efflux transporter MFP subunit
MLAAAVALLVAGGLCYREMGAKAVVRSEAEPAARSEAKSSSRAIPVETVRLAKGGIVRTSAQIGTVHPYEEADLFAKVSGYLANLHVDYGDHVKRDQLLAEIDDPEIVEDAKKAAADLLQAEAAVAQAKAFIESAKADRDASATSVDQTIAEVDRYVSTRTFREKVLARHQRLVASKAIPQEVVDEDEEHLDSARAAEVSAQKAVLNARAQLVAANARVKKAEADLTEAEANVEVSRAKLNRANVLVGYTKITSPYDGVITKRNFFRGAFIRSASEGGLIPLLTVARTDKVRVVTQVPDRDVPLTSVGDEAEVTLDALAGEVLKGNVSRFAETEDPTSRTMHTEIDLDNSQGKIRPGMYGIAKIILDRPMKSSTLPAACLVGESKDGKAEVFVIRNGKARKIQIFIDADDGLRVDVLSGLSPSDAVIVSTGSVTEGMAVQGIESRGGRPTPPVAKRSVAHPPAQASGIGSPGPAHH